MLYLELEKIQQKNSSLGNNNFTGKVLVTQILIWMLDKYENKIDHIKHLIDSGHKLNIVQVLGHLRDKYISLTKGKSFDSRTSSNNTVLFAKQSKGYCRECGEYGHKQADCPKLKNNKKNPKNFFAKN